jgi:DNA-binding LacI/PurR family transcriptional regulator
MKKYLDKPAVFTAMTCMTGVIYDGILKAFEEKNIKVPDNVSAVVCNSTDTELTRIEFDLKDLGRAAVELLCSKVSSLDWKPKRVLVSNRLALGNSTQKGKEINEKKSNN